MAEMCIQILSQKVIIENMFCSVLSRLILHYRLNSLYICLCACVYTHTLVDEPWNLYLLLLLLTPQASHYWVRYLGFNMSIFYWWQVFFITVLSINFFLFGCGVFTGYQTRIWNQLMVHWVKLIGSAICHMNITSLLGVGENLVTCHFNLGKR